MGVCGSSSKHAKPVAASAPAPKASASAQQGAVILGSTGGHKGHGGKVQSKKAPMWQIMLDGQWKNYDPQEDRILKRAWLVGQSNCRFSLRGQRYEYNFRAMTQKNLGTGKERRIRPPCGLKPPKQALLPTGPMIMLTVRKGQPGQMITVKDPNNPGQTINVFVPHHAKPGSKMAVPVPEKGQTIQMVQEKQKKWDEEKQKGGWSTGGKVAAGGAALVGVGVVGVGGVILGDHLAGGDLAGEIGVAVGDAGEAVGDAVEDAGEAIADWAPGAVEDIGEWAGDAVDWLGDAGEDVGDFVMDLF